MAPSPSSSRWPSVNIPSLLPKLRRAEKQLGFYPICKLRHYPDAGRKHELGVLQTKDSVMALPKYSAVLVLVPTTQFLQGHTNKQMVSLQWVACSSGLLSCLSWRPLFYRLPFILLSSEQTCPLLWWETLAVSPSSLFSSKNVIVSGQSVPLPVRCTERPADMENSLRNL